MVILNTEYWIMYPPLWIERIHIQMNKIENQNIYAVVYERAAK